MTSPVNVLMPTHIRLAQLCAQEAQTAHQAGSETKPQRWCSPCGAEMVAGVCPNCGCIAAECASAPSLPSVANPLQALQDRIAAWQAATFPNKRLDGRLAHLAREAGELRAKPEDLMEWADVYILFLGSAASIGLTVQDLQQAAERKFAIAQTRQWGPADSEGVHHHLG